MKKPKTTNLDKERAGPLGDTGNRDTGVPDGAQGISNRAGDKDDDADEFEEDDPDELEDEEEEDGGA
jgi:hypothetical protein